MKKDVKRRWIKALRSGKFKRGQGRLCHNNRFCCLGVLCETEKIQYDPNDGMPPDTFLKRIKLPYSEAWNLTQINDGVLEKGLSAPKGYSTTRGASFRAIADWISRHIPEE